MRSLNRLSGLGRALVLPRRPWRTLCAASILVASLAAGGCAALQGKLTSSQVADTSYFTDQTISMLASVRLEMNGDETIYTRKYWSEDDPDEEALREAEANVLDVFRGVVEYALAIVNIADDPGSESEKIARYANWFGPWRASYVDQLGVDQAQYERTIRSIRAQKTLRGAFLAAHPLLNSVNLYTNRQLDGIIRQAGVIVRKTEAEIDADYADVIHYQEKLNREKFRILRALEDVYDAHAGVDGAYERLKANRAVRRKDLLAAAKPSEAQLEAIGKHLLRRLETLDLVGKQIESEWNSYRAAHRELDQLHAALLKDVTSVRIVMLVWVHAHYQLGQGRTQPAEWFDLSEATRSALKLAF